MLFIKAFYSNFPIPNTTKALILLHRTNSTHADFIELVKKLDADLAIRDGNEHAFYAQFNAIDKLNNVIVAFIGDVAVSCGAMKEIEPGTMEIKRMFTLPEYRGKRIATKVLAELETWGLELGFDRFVLETGKKQPEAIALYTHCGYAVIPNYGQYAGVENSICFEKMLHKTDI